MYNEHLIDKAVEALVDMFNDEISDVRINAIHTLRKIGTRWYLELNEEDLEIVASTLEDAHGGTRHATHDLMGVARLNAPTSLLALLDAFKANIGRYPEDLMSIYHATAQIGKRHADFVVGYIIQLLRLDPQYMTRDPNAEDPTYTMNVILIANACTVISDILAKLPAFVFQHFSYYKIKYPDCIPDLQTLYASAPDKVKKELGDLPSTPLKTVDTMDIEEDQNRKSYLSVTMSMLARLEQHIQQQRYADADVVVTDAIKSFQYLTSIQSTSTNEIQDEAQLAIAYLECYHQVLKIKTSYGSPSFGVSGQLLAAALLRQSYLMQHTFLGLSTWNTQVAVYFRILSNLIWVFSIFKEASRFKEKSIELQSLFAAFIRRIDDVRKYFDDASWVKYEIEQLRSSLVDAQETFSPSIVYELYKSIKGYVPMMIDLDNSTKYMHAVITSPVPNPDKPFKYPAAFPGKIEFEADLYNSRDVHDIGIEVVLPDQSSRIFWPTHKDFTPITPYCYKLQTELHIPETNIWTEPGSIILRMVRSFTPDLPELDLYILNYPNAGANSIDLKDRTASVVISKEIQYTLWPYYLHNRPPIR